MSGNRAVNRTRASQALAAAALDPGAVAPVGDGMVNGEDRGAPLGR